ncbi:hypothetical protein TRIP_B50735 [uncultured Desulfatiglans sp.]|uniref:Uncharacterized protein n=1 Tax=Uncultured Desulfatiglans sp. TaxID=1748965 RepID=A0A653AIP0_UNCDX|nr:hypothetical protein TRIP_B50735 [uncultured Desulfatiglans sp.]
MNRASLGWTASLRLFPDWKPGSTGKSFPDGYKPDRDRPRGRPCPTALRLGLFRNFPCLASPIC